MQPDIEREYLKLIDEVEAHFAARVRWSEDGRMSAPSLAATDIGVALAASFEGRWLLKLHQVRTRELTAMVQAARA